MLVYEYRGVGEIQKPMKVHENVQLSSHYKSF